MHYLPGIAALDNREYTEYKRSFTSALLAECVFHFCYIMVLVCNFLPMPPARPPYLQKNLLLGASDQIGGDMITVRYVVTFAWHSFCIRPSSDIPSTSHPGLIVDKPIPRHHVFFCISLQRLNPALLTSNMYRMLLFVNLHFQAPTNTSRFKASYHAEIKKGALTRHMNFFLTTSKPLCMMFFGYVPVT